MSAQPVMVDAGAVTRAAPATADRRWTIVGALSVTETISWGILYYAFAVVLVPMRDDLGLSTAQLGGAFSVALLVSAAAGVLVGRHLDRHTPRTLMTAGSIAGALLVLAWSQVQSLAGVYAVWAGMGVVMATVLYEPAFVVLAKHFPDPGQRRRAMTTMTLAGALASFIFLPLTHVLIDAHGWRDAVALLGLLLALTTVPLHAVALRAAPASPTTHEPTPSVSAREALRTGPFWLLSIAFCLAAFAGIAMTVHAIPFLIGEGHSAGFAAFALGLVGISQIPGRILYTPIAARWPRPVGTAALFVLIAAGIALLAAIGATWAVLVGVVLLGMGNGMSTLARATTLADLYGPAAYGSIAGTAAAMTTTARAAGPVLAAVFAAALSYQALLWCLAATALVAAALAARAEAIAGGSVASQSGADLHD